LTYSRLSGNHSPHRRYASGKRGLAFGFRLQTVAAVVDIAHWLGFCTTLGDKPRIR